jgi:hypothetical protein
VSVVASLQYNTVEPQFTNLISSWRPFVTQNVHKPKLCVLSKSYTATDTLPPTLPACCQPLLPACVFVTWDTICHLRLLFSGKFVREPICSWWEAFMNWGSLHWFLSPQASMVAKLLWSTWASSFCQQRELQSSGNLKITVSIDKLKGSRVSKKTDNNIWGTYITKKS